MPDVCTRCGFVAQASARFCGRCGLSLEPGMDGSRSPGSIRDARPEPMPPGFIPVDLGANLSYAWESTLGGGAPLASEGLLVRVFNAGHALRDLVLEISCFGRDNAPCGRYEELFRELDRGAMMEFEVPSHRLSGEVRAMRLKLISAEFLTAS